MSGDGTYWKSLEQLADDPRARRFLENEFPEGASEPPQGVSRRTLIKLLGASLSLAGMAACRRPEERIVPYVTAPEEIVPGIPRRYASTMPLGTEAYGVVVESHEGRPTKIEGNELHPASGGSSSAWMQAAILDLYDPDRSAAVLQDGASVDWEAFLAAWAALEPGLADRQGEGLAVLTEPFSSPTLARMAAEFRERLPRARLAAWEAVSDENVLRGVEIATGRALRPVYHLDRADVVVALDADLLLTETDALRHARGFATRRRVVAPADSMSRLWVAEGPLSVTGANADHRLRLAGSAIAGLVARLSAELGGPALAPGGAAAIDAAWLGALLADLREHRGTSLLVAGRRQPAAVHAAVLALNAALGNLGATVTLHETPHLVGSSREALAELAEAMRSGAVETLVVIGANPVYDGLADLGFGEALERVGRVIHVGARRDETALRAQWHVPRAHFLESWSDAAAADGTPSVVQPLIAPLLGGRSDAEVWSLLARGAAQPAHDLVRETWTGLLGETDFERRWNRVLHDGVHGAGAPAPLSPGVRAADVQRAWQDRGAAPGAGRELVFAISPTVHDGRFANSGWLQELPDPITKLTWDNAALISPALAAEIGAGNGDVVRVSHAGREIELPAWIVPGQADACVVLPLGWGRTAAGRIGSGRGVDVYPLRTAAAADFGSGVEIRRTGATLDLATTQDHHTVDALGERERDRRVDTLLRETDLAEFRRRPEFAREAVEHPPLESLWTEHAYDSGYQWGMSIDLNVCTGCSACTIACQSENNIPIVGKDQVGRGREMHWLRIDRYFRGGVAEPQAVFQPVPCMHCENAPCEQVCPVAATVHDGEGLNTMVYNRCIGTRYCLNNCPYKVRRFNFYNFTKDTPELQRMANNPDVTVRSRGVMEKCTYCIQRINAAKIDARLAGREVRDGEIRTACQQACPTQAIVFGNVQDPGSRVSQAKAQPRDYAMLAELNNKPRTTYLAKLRNPHPALAGEPAAGDAAEAGEGHG